MNYTPSKSLQFKLSIDASSQDISAIDDKTLKTGESTTLGGFLIGRYNLNDKFSITGRAEFYNTHSEIDKLYLSEALGHKFGTECKPNAKNC